MRETAPVSNRYLTDQFSQTLLTVVGPSLTGRLGNLASFIAARTCWGFYTRFFVRIPRCSDRSREINRRHHVPLACLFVYRPPRPPLSMSGLSDFPVLPLAPLRSWGSRVVVVVDVVVVAVTVLSGAVLGCGLTS